MATLEKFKLTAQTWDSGKNPEGFTKWMQNVSSMVRTLKHGLPLEKFLDRILRRTMYTGVTTPSFLHDDEYGPPPQQDGGPTRTPVEVLQSLSEEVLSQVSPERPLEHDSDGRNETAQNASASIGQLV